MRDRLRLSVRFDSDALRRDLARLEGTAWTDHFVTQNYEGTWSVLPLRAPVGAVHPIKMIYSDPACTTFVDTPLLERCPYFQQVLALFPCPLHAVRLMKLTPGSAIKPHTDHDLAADYGRVRLHIPITTNPDVDFRLNGERVTMGEGECWYLRLSDTHTVMNGGRTDRVHLVLDALVNPWLHEQLANAERAADEPRSSLLGWIPVKVRADSARPMVDWCFLGEDTFTDPFFEQTIARCSGSSSNRPRRQETPIETLIEWRTAQPGIEPTAFIFHGSRCGSTLLTQMAAALPATVVISEAPPIDDVLRARATDDARIEWLRALLSALGQPRRGDERHLFVKFDAWHAMDLAVVRRAFPHVPCVFLYREPAEVIASQLRMPGLHMIPGMLDPSLLGLDLPGVLRLDREELCARVLATLYRAAVAHAAAGGVMLMNYSQFPEAASSRVLEWCGLADREDARDRLRHVAQFDAKTPSLPFDAADRSARPAPTKQALDAAARFVDSSYAQLESIRLAPAVLRSAT